MGDFYDAWNQSLDTAEGAFGESFTVGTTSHDAINIEELDAPTKAALGGRFVNATLTLEVSRTVVQTAGIKRGTYLQARGQKLEVIDPKDDGTGSLTLICGPMAGGAPR